MSVDFPGIGDEINRPYSDLETEPEHWVFGYFRTRPPSLRKARGRQRTRHLGPLIEPISNYQGMCLDDYETSAATGRQVRVAPWRFLTNPTLNLTAATPLIPSIYSPFVIRE